MKEKSYDNVAELYDEVTDNPVRRFLLPVSKLAKKYGAKSILEIGCGTGRFPLGLAEKEFSVTGIDSSKQMLKKAGFGKIKVFGSPRLPKIGRNPKELVFIAEK